MRHLVACVLLSLSGTVYAQSGSYDKAPQYPGGNEALQRYLTEKLVYPEKAKKKSIEGQVMVGFTVNDKGKVGDIRILQHAHALLDSEAVRVVRTMPRWQPATKGKTAVIAPVALPLTFKMHSSGGPAGRK